MTASAQRTAIGIGASGGIGRAVALRLARDGFSAVAHYSGNSAKADELVSAIKAQGGKAIGVKAEERRHPVRTADAMTTISEALFSDSSCARTYRRRGQRHAWISKCIGRSYGRLQPTDRLLADGVEPPLGAHLVTPRLGFTHHGIYAGDGRVIHYGSFAASTRRRPVEEVSVSHFAQRHPVLIRSNGLPRFDGVEVLCRARSRIGEDRYRLLSNNCEHFCEWCMHGEQRSYQVERILNASRRTLRAVSFLLPALLLVPPLSDSLA